MTNIVSKWFVYIVECSDATYYTGISTDVEARVKTHNAGKGAKYTKPRLPVKLLWSSPCENKSEALKEEIRIKKLSKLEKIALVNKVGLNWVKSHRLKNGGEKIITVKVALDRFILHPTGEIGEAINMYSLYDEETKITHFLYKENADDRIREILSKEDVSK